jgi:hypothetical protein
LEAEHGLASIPGGRHPGWGTANRIVPLGDAYLELVGVVDEREAAGSPFGRWVAGGTPGRPLGWAVRTDDLDGVVRRLGLTVTPGSRTLPGGDVLGWRHAGFERAAAEPTLPFFIQWEDAAPFPGKTAISHPVGRIGIERLELNGDAGRLDAWLGEHALPVVVRPGTPGLSAVVFSGGGRLA